jgi:hypothetical protein
VSLTGQTPTTLNGMYVRRGGLWHYVVAPFLGAFAAYRYVATAAQTVLSGADANGGTLAYTPGAIMVTVNGVTLAPNTYTATNGTSVVLGTALSASDAVVIHSFGSFSVADAESANFTPAGSGAVVRTIQSKLRESVSVKDFGAVGDGVVDDTAAIQAAIDYVEMLNGGIVNIPQGTFKITSTITVNSAKTVELIGQGGDANHNDGADQDTPTRLSWHGAAGGTMVHFTSPSGPAGTTKQNGSSFKDIRLDCRLIGGIGLLVTSVTNGTFSRVYVSNPTIAGLKTTTLGTSALPEDIGTQRCVFDRITVRAFDGVASRPAHGIWVTSHNPAILSTANTSLNVFSQCDMVLWGGVGGGHGMFFEDGDNNTVVNLRVFRSNTNSAAVALVGNAACDANHFWNLSAGGANSVTIRGTASGFAINPVKNSFWVVDVGNGTQYPTADTGVVFGWHSDENLFFNQGFVRAAIGDGIVSADTARTSLGLYSLMINNGSNSHIGLIQGANAWSIAIDGASGDLRFLRVSGSGTVDVGLGAPVKILGANVSVGAADSGGTGFRVLRVPN